MMTYCTGNISNQLLRTQIEGKNFALQKERALIFLQQISQQKPIKLENLNPLVQISDRLIFPILSEEKDGVTLSLQDLRSKKFEWVKIISKSNHPNDCDFKKWQLKMISQKIVLINSLLNIFAIDSGDLLGQINIQDLRVRPNHLRIIAEKIYAINDIGILFCWNLQAKIESIIPLDSEMIKKLGSNLDDALNYTRLSHQFNNQIHAPSNPFYFSVYENKIIHLCKKLEYFQQKILFKYYDLETKDINFLSFDDILSHFPDAVIDQKLAEPCLLVQTGYRYSHFMALICLMTFKSTNQQSIEMHISVVVDLRNFKVEIKRFPLRNPSLEEKVDAKRRDFKSQNIPANQSTANIPDDTIHAVEMLDINHQLVVEDYKILQSTFNQHWMYWITDNEFKLKATNWMTGKIVELHHDLQKDVRSQLFLEQDLVILLLYPSKSDQTNSNQFRFICWDEMKLIKLKEVTINLDTKINNIKDIYLSLKDNYFRFTIPNRSLKPEIYLINI